MSVSSNPPSGSVPIPCDYLTVQAADLAIEATAFVRASVEAHRVYHEAGRRAEAIHSPN